MVRIMDVCKQLGLSDGGRVLGSRDCSLGSDDSKLSVYSLPEETRAFIHEYKSSAGTCAVDLPVMAGTGQPGIFEMTLEFLETGVGQRYWATDKSVLPENLRWPQDKIKIAGLVAQIFLEQIRNFWTGKTYDTHDHSTQKGHSTTGLSTSSATRRNSFEVTSLTEDTHDAVLYSGQGLDGMNVDQIAQSSPMSTNQVQPASVSTSPKPIAFDNVEEMLLDLQQWCQKNPDLILPGALGRNTTRFNSTEPKKVEYEGVTGQVLYFIIDINLMGRMLKCSDGRIYYLQYVRSSSSVVRYQMWGGEKLGFLRDCILSYTPETSTTSTTQAKMSSRTLPSVSRSRSGLHSDKMKLRSQNRRRNRDICKVDSEDQSLLGSYNSRIRPLGQARNSSRNARSSVYTQHPDYDLAPTQSGEAMHISSPKPGRTRYPSPEIRSSPMIKRSRSPSLEILSGPPKRPSYAFQNVDFHFYLPETEFGAIDKPVLDCNTVDSFFRAAQAAWVMLEGDSKKDPNLVAVRVTWDGLKIPMVVPWKDSESFQRMMSSVQQARADIHGNMAVEVRCLKRG